LIFSEVISSNGGSQADDLLELELNGRLEFLDLRKDGLTLSDGEGELADLVEDVTAESGNLFHERF